MTAKNQLQFGQKIKRAIFHILITITLEVNMITRQTTLFFLSTLSDLSTGLLHSCILKPSKFSPMGSSFALCYCPKNTHLHVKDKTFKPISI